MGGSLCFSLLWGSIGFKGAYSVGVRVLVQEGKICLRSKSVVLAQNPGRIPQDNFCFSLQFALGWGPPTLDMLVAAQFHHHRGEVAAAEAGQDVGTLVLALSVLLHVPAGPVTEDVWSGGSTAVPSRPMAGWHGGEFYEGSWARFPSTAPCQKLGCYAWRDQGRGGGSHFQRSKNLVGPCSGAEVFLLSKGSLQMEAVLRVSCTAGGLAGDSLAAGHIRCVSDSVFLGPQCLLIG